MPVNEAPPTVDESVSFRCELCGGSTHLHVLSAPDRLGLAESTIEIRRCSSCGLAFTWPPTSDRELANFYPDEYWGESTEPSHDWIVRTQREKTRLVERHAPRGGRLLDVGCGAGFFLRALPPERWERCGVEISSRSAEVADRHVGPDRVVVGSLLDAPFEDGSFDVITFWASLEHVPNPATTLDRARRLLDESGLVVVQVPNFEGYQSRAFGADWFALDLPRHRHHFTPATLEALLDRAGFAPIETLFRSETHDPHGLKQSLKTRLLGRQDLIGRLGYYAAAPFVRLADRIAGGSTLTVTARVR